METETLKQIVEKAKEAGKVQTRPNVRVIESKETGEVILVVDGESIHMSPAIAKALASALRSTALKVSNDLKGNESYHAPHPPRFKTGSKKRRKKGRPERPKPAPPGSI